MKYDGTNMEQVLEEHKKYIESRASLFWGLDIKIESLEGSIADFSEATLTGINFKNMDLSLAIFSKAILKRDVVFTNVNLTKSNFCAVQSYGTIFNQVSLRNAWFEGASLDHNVFNIVDLADANFRGASLNSSDFNRAFISETIGLDEAVNVPSIPQACPSHGAFIGWKKAQLSNGYRCLVKLLIPEDAKRSSAGGRKCRCDKAVVLGIEECFSGCDIDPDEEIMSLYDRNFVYKVGDVITPKGVPFYANRWKECASGIHFFITREEAAYY